MQHTGDIWPLASFPPTECLIGPASWRPRAALVGWGRTRDFGIREGGRGLTDAPVPLLDSLSTGPGYPLP